MSARDILVDIMKARGLPNPEWEADVALNRLSMEGYRILGPDELDPVIQALRKAEDGAGTLPARETVKLVPAHWHELASAIRSLSPTQPEAKEARDD